MKRSNQVNSFRELGLSKFFYETFDSGGSLAELFDEGRFGVQDVKEEDLLAYAKVFSKRVEPRKIAFRPLLCKERRALIFFREDDKL